MSGLVKKLLFCGASRFPPVETAPEDLREGYIWLHVGTTEEKQRRFEVEAYYLNHPLLEDLLRRSEDEFGYTYQGAVRVVCDTELFQHIVDLLRSSIPSAHYMELQELIDNYYGTAGQAPQFRPPAAMRIEEHRKEG